MLREAAEAIQSKLPYADTLAGLCTGGAIPANCDDCRSAALAAHPDRGGSADAFAAVAAAYARCAKTYTELGPQADAIFQVRANNSCWLRAGWGWTWYRRRRRVWSIL